MTYKEALFFTGKCLTILHEKHNYESIEKELKNGQVNWEAVVKVSTSHFVFPAMYINLKKAGFLKYLPNDLVTYMNHITDLNRVRNEQILEQALALNQLLLKHDIKAIFLKGTANLLEGLYEDIAERMVGDIDILVSKNDYHKSINIILNDGYNPIKKTKNIKWFHWHYPRVIKDGSIAALEIHNKLLRKPFHKHLELEALSVYKRNNFYYLSKKDKVLNAILPKIFNDNLYYSKKISLKTAYDVYLLTKKINKEVIFSNQKINTKLNNVLNLIGFNLNSNITKCVQDKYSLKYINDYISILEGSKNEQLKIRIQHFFSKTNERLSVFFYSFIDKQYRNYALKRIFEKEFYQQLLGFKPNA